MMRFLVNIFGAYKLRALVIVLAVSSIYLYVFPSPTLVYIAVVLLHAALGIIAGIFLVVKLRGIFSPRAFQDNSGWLLIFFGALVGTALFFIGTSRPQWNWMYAHIALSFAGIAALASRWAGRKGWKAKVMVRMVHFFPVRRKPQIRKKSRASTSWNRMRASAAMVTSTGSGIVRSITSRRSIISGIARALSICRMLWA